MAGSPIYHTRAWYAVRLMTLVRDGYRCQIGLPGCKGRANSADHIVELGQGGDPYDLGNLQAACMPCNISKRNTRIISERRGRVRGVVRSW